MSPTVADAAPEFGGRPSGWFPATVADVAVARMGKTIIAHELSETGLPVYSAARDDRPWGFIAKSDVVFDRGTIVVSARGTIGFIRLPPDEFFVSTQTTIALRPSTGVLPEYLRYALRRVDWAPVTSTTTIPMLTIGQINNVRAPLPPTNEQRRIVEKLDAIFAKTSQLRARLARLLGATDAGGRLGDLEHTALAKAFRGELVAQDPNDEPASALLDRIRAEREAGPLKSKRGRRPKALVS
ncbi:MAG: restriction endonuclease subunit S [Deltaproteobacteria bacterium]|nr:restriction endonuclease subunit S [Deltaproteobacteria bacterium]